MKKILLLSILAIASISCKETKEKSVKKEASIETVTQTTAVTPENYGLAETQEIMNGYVKKIAKATGTNGTGVIMNVREGADSKDRTIMRINFDTIYSSFISPQKLILMAHGKNRSLLKLNSFKEISRYFYNKY